MRAGRFPIDAAEPLLPNHGALAADDDRGAREAAGANPPLHHAINDAQARCRHPDGSRCFDRQSSVSSSYGEGSEQRKHHGGPLLPKRPTEPRPETHTGLGAWGSTPGLSKSDGLQLSQERGQQQRTVVRNGKLAGFDPVERPHDLRSGELSYFNMWGCIQLARRNTCSFVTRLASASSCAWWYERVGLRRDRVIDRSDRPEFWPRAEVADKALATELHRTVTKQATGMETDHALIRRAIDGDERALRQLWSQYSPHIDAVVRRLVGGDADLAADIAQDVWIQIFRALGSYRGDAQFGTWAHRIAVNRTLNALRKARRLGRLEVEIEEDSSAVEMDSDRAFLAASIEEAAARLPAGARTVFVLHDVEGYTHDDIARELGITTGASKSQLFKARARLRRLLAHLIDVPTPATELRTHVAPRS